MDCSGNSGTKIVGSNPTRVVPPLYLFFVSMGGVEFVVWFDEQYVFCVCVGVVGDEGDDVYSSSFDSVLFHTGC